MRVWNRDGSLRSFFLFANGSKLFFKILLCKAESIRTSPLTRESVAKERVLRQLHDARVMRSVLLEVMQGRRLLGKSTTCCPCLTLRMRQ